MENLLFLIPILPLAGFLVNGLGQRRLSERAVSVVACLASAASLALSIAAVRQLVVTGTPLTQILGIWIEAGDASFRFGLRVDALTSVMLLVVTGIGTLIHLYATGYMHGDRSFARFFAYLNLFLSAMLVLVMSDNLALLFVGWEGVGLCSYLLIGFWYEDPKNAEAGKKAFLVNRIGDLGFLLGAFTLFAACGSLDFLKLSAISPDSVIATGLFKGWRLAETFELAAAFLFVGACGKSAQIPLYVWLPDAMAGPTPVSALIHAATMVTAGIYLTGRLHFVYSAAPQVLQVMAVVGATTALLGALIAVAQNDIKKILAYSTISQLGYMFAGMSSQAYHTGVFHLMTHAFFKALLFLGAGTVIHLLGGEQDIRKMGGLAQKHPLLFVLFATGGVALAGVYGFSGFHSKDAILAAILGVDGYHDSITWTYSWWALLLSAFLTAFYMTRLVLTAFFGEARESHAHGHAPGWAMILPLVVLAGLSALGGRIHLDTWLASLWGSVEINETFHHRSVYNSQLACGLGIGLGVLLFGILRARNTRLFAGGILENKFYVDEIYEYLIVLPLRMGATMLWYVVDRLLIDTGLVHGAAAAVTLLSRGARRFHNGLLSSSTAGILLGVLAGLAWIAYQWYRTGGILT